MSDATIEVQFKPKYFTAKKLLPLLLALAVIIVDQVTKILITENIPLYGLGGSFFGDFLRIIHVNNPGIAFSIGQGWSIAVRSILFRAIPLIVLIVVLGVYMRNDDFSSLQRWSISGIAGGGFGNLIDRFFRTEGVVDFIDVKWFGIEKSPFKFLRWERWPTFNIADAAVVVCGILLIISFVITMKKTQNKGGAE
ncbi:signal peptidase II [Treponema sp.]|uniref:signal peptidase II n=1 Tax=Treponema sp. TaxID=166 RepID=UPI0025DA346C|nr:signal peptidase II [Treponema sp.]MBR4322256.1 signal peptidase II [Treponema sp.]